MILTRAPFRISLGGGGTDLPSYYADHGGFVLSAAINKYLYICVNRPAADEYIRLKYSKYEQVTSPDDLQHDLVKPALKMLDVSGSLEITSMADVPAGTGLGSSGTYLVALLTGLHELRREKLPTQVVAEEACHIEMNLAGHPVGKHDHYLAAFGGITSLEINADGNVKVSPLDASVETVEQLRANVLLFYTGITRASSDILEKQRRETVAGSGAMLDNLHRTKEIGYRIKAALEDGDVDAFGRLMHEHWLNKKERDGAVTGSQIDCWYQRARDCGALGGKVIGAGGGGFLMLYCPNGSKAAVRETLKRAGLREMPYDFDFDGAKTLVNF